MNPSNTTAHFNLTSAANPVIGSRVTATLLIILVFVFAATGEQAGAFLACALLSIAWPLFLHAWFCLPEITPSAMADKAIADKAQHQIINSLPPSPDTAFFPTFAYAL
jgi:hypothetical protein